MEPGCNNFTKPEGERKVAHSVEYRRKDNGNIIASIYPPDSSLLYPQHVNHDIEKELREFMTENEEKFKNSKMNQKFVFPRKKPQPDMLNFTQAILNPINPAGSSSYRSNKTSRRYKSQENPSKVLFKPNPKITFKPLNGNFMPADSGSTDSVRKNYKILQKTLNLNMNMNMNMPERNHKNFKIKLNQSIIKLNRKSSNRKKRTLTETINSHNSIRKIKSTERGVLRLDKRLDNRGDKRGEKRVQRRHKINTRLDTQDFSTRSFINYSSSKGIPFKEITTPKETTRRKKQKRKSNKTPVGRYARKNREMVNANFQLTGKAQKSIDGPVLKSKTEFSSPKLFCIPSNQSIQNQSYRVKHR